MAKPKIISSEPCEYRDVSCDIYGYQKWFRDEVTYNQALDDLESLVYLLKSIIRLRFRHGGEKITNLC